MDYVVDIEERFSDPIYKNIIIYYFVIILLHIITMAYYATNGAYFVFIKLHAFEMFYMQKLS